MYQQCNTCRIFNCVLYLGVTIIEGTKVEKVTTNSKRVKGVHTNRGHIACEFFVNCAGQVKCKTYDFISNLIFRIVLIKDIHSRCLKHFNATLYLK